MTETKMTIEKIEDTDHAAGVSLTRRRLLAGSLGATVGGLIAADAVLGQEHVHVAQANTAASHGTLSGSLSNRIYSVNPTFPDMADMA
jgi:nitrite reductase (NO-forming)